KKRDSTLSLASTNCNTAKLDSRKFKKINHTERQQRVLIWVYWKAIKGRLGDLETKEGLFSKALTDNSNKENLLKKLEDIIDLEQREITTLENSSPIDIETKDLETKYYCFLSFSIQVYRNTRVIIKANQPLEKVYKLAKSNSFEEDLRIKELEKAANDLDNKFQLSKMG
ncbi:MAG: hypothetical protein M3004_08925, partial [Bacteroidota bacterium]|nr:hypothetical protein [Bacteroidota bacterium]